MTDSELVDCVRQGDQGAYGVLVDRHRDAVFRTALAALGSPPDAEEVAQDSFVTAFRQIDRFRGEASFKTWLLTIAWRRALTRRRSLVRRLRLFVTSRDEWPDPPAAGPSPEQALVDGHLRAAIRTLIRSLPGDLRDALLLTATSSQTYGEVAEILGIPVGTLKWRVVEARRQLKMKLARLGYRDD